MATRTKWGAVKDHLTRSPVRDGDAAPEANLGNADPELCVRLLQVNDSFRQSRIQNAVGDVFRSFSSRKAASVQETMQFTQETNRLFQPSDVKMMVFVSERTLEHNLDVFRQDRVSVSIEPGLTSPCPLRSPRRSTTRACGAAWRPATPPGCFTSWSFRVWTC